MLLTSACNHPRGAPLISSRFAASSECIPPPRPAPSSTDDYLFAVLLCGRPKRPHYGSCPPVRPSLRPSVANELLTRSSEGDERNKIAACERFSGQQFSGHKVKKVKRKAA